MSCASHNHAIYNLDGRDVFDPMERATRGSSNFSGTLTTYHHRKDGHGAFMAYGGQGIVWGTCWADGDGLGGQEGRQ